ncbi:C-mannosyltransferase dpy-19 homolog [Episyrphus balteatus]|uniref:C-mannosyltransferase dpy-19 homolog n=1 Tax=Episyrphus balteatus TaxID=286459 RepID=UPI002484FC13|nr:C-mannosyltransferase dpy-19 homolog [Episyrphus balteatus]
MKQKHYLLLILSHAFIAVGCFFLYVYHVRSIFETRHNFGHITTLEREALLRKEDALYYSFYKTIVQEADFYQGYQKLLNVTTIEYPHSVNVVHRFHVFPEIAIGYLYHKFKSLSKSLGDSSVSCWTDDSNPLSEPVITCDGLGEPFHFYLEFVWMFGGFTVFLIYMYASFLSENLLGGIYAVASYIIFHKNVSKIYDRPVARENFAFPLIFWQMFYLCICINKASKSKKPNQHYFNPIMIIKLTILTTASLLCWQFSSVVYATQVLILITPWSLGLVSSRFSIDYTITQFLSNILAYYFTYENKKYFFAWQNGPAFALFFISLVRIYKSQSRSDNFLKSITLGILLAISSQGTIIDLLEKSGYASSTDNPFSVYRDLVLQWTLQRKTNFTTCLLACNSDYAEVDIYDVWEVIKILFAKPYCLYGVVLLAKFLRKWRIQTPKSEDTDYVERAKKYVLEEFLEENHISMKDMSNEKTEKALKECLDLLEKCDYEFQKYKEERNKMKKDVGKEHESFLNEIKCLKKQIKETNKERKHENQFDSGLDLKRENTSTSADHSSKPESQVENEEKPTVDADLLESKPKEPEKKTQWPKSNSKTDSTFSYHYLYSLAQFAVFIFIGFSIKKLFFLCYTQGCVLAPTLYSKLRNHKHSNLFLSISLAVFLTSIVDPGVVNVYEEYLPSKTHSDELENMLEWINLNTEKNAVFGGPVDIIGTVHLTTKRPIVNHAHLDMHQISERTESIYSVFSRQQSSEIYNQCSQLKIQYLILSFSDCSNAANDECDILTIWDEMQPAYRKYPQFCSELASKNVPSFLKVFSNKYYGIIKMFSQSVQLNLKQNKMPEKHI